VTDAALGHQRHQPIDTVAGGARHHVGRHDRAHAGVESTRSAVGERPHDVALGDDAFDLAAVTRDDEGADASLAELAYGVVQ
jgi:hypothetical protein